jgi:CheY-like chemotaxis protein
MARSGRPEIALLPSRVAARTVRAMTAAHPRVLLVEDVALVRRALARALRITGFDVVDVASIDAAREALHRDAFDVVMTDEDLGHAVDGVALLAEVRDALPSARRVLVSGTAPDTLDRDLEVGLVERFHEKPISIDELRDLRRWAAPGSGERGFAGATAAARNDTRALAGVRVLAVDDHLDTLEVSRMLLSASGADVTCASSAETALAMLTRETFDVLVCDVEMPSMDGLDLIREIRRRSDAKARMPALALSGYSLPYQIDRAREAGFDDYAIKPIGGELVHSVQRVLGAARSISARPRPA